MRGLRSADGLVELEDTGRRGLVLEIDGARFDVVVSDAGWGVAIHVCDFRRSSR